ncbi:sodium-coupled neutral amino acid transporter 4-like [Prunus yedoensis var. nudiflora]|uniref:Sodium-coupled neutral amino acid transporter 4-like n=1 Tax=Prunus yedoensis var. nudiflora TaxID=2094558 RepID=A0A314UPJ4_PRUYE|nr:sodium-coupled neutral amino acid transporter 4-like [Prunus yedoensis var. nudiflora]
MSTSQSEHQLVDERTLLLPTSQNEEAQAGFGKPSRGASFHGSVFNLSCTVIGSGIMSLPATLNMLGLIPGVALIIIAAFLTEASIDFLLRFSKPGSAFSYGDVMGEAFGKVGKVLLQLCVIINNIGSLTVGCFSGSTSNGVHHAGILEESLGVHWWTGRAFVLIVLTVVVIVPLICFKRIDSLRFTSAISITLAVVFLVTVIVITVYKLILGSIEAPALFPSVTGLTSFLNLFTAFPVVVFAYVCHFNVHSIQNELEDSRRMPAIVQTTVALCAFVYVMTGVFGFLLFGESTLSDLLSNFDTDLGIPYSSVFNDIVRISYIGHILLVYPIVLFPLRLNLDGLLFPSARPLASDNVRFSLISSGIVVITLLGAILIPSIWVAFEFTGATVGALIAFIFPACIVLKDPHGIAWKKDKIVSVFMIIVAVVSSVVAIYSDALSLLT